MKRWQRELLQIIPFLILGIILINLLIRRTGP